MKPQIESHKKEVLVIDDDEVTRSVLEVILEGGGFSVHVCPDPSSILQSSKEHSFHAYIVDYHLPHMKGDSLTAVIRKLRPNAIIIGCSIQSKERVFLASGADGFVLKENVVSQLLRVLAETGRLRCT